MWTRPTVGPWLAAMGGALLFVACAGSSAPDSSEDRRQQDGGAIETATSTPSGTAEPNTPSTSSIATLADAADGSVPESSNPADSPGADRASNSPFRLALDGVRVSTTSPEYGSTFELAVDCASAVNEPWVSISSDQQVSELELVELGAEHQVPGSERRSYSIDFAVPYWATVGETTQLHVSCGDDIETKALVIAAPADGRRWDTWRPIMVLPSLTGTTGIDRGLVDGDNITVDVACPPDTNPASHHLVVALTYLVPDFNSDRAISTTVARHNLPGTTVQSADPTGLVTRFEYTLDLSEFKPPPADATLAPEAQLTFIGRCDDLPTVWNPDEDDAPYEAATVVL